MSLRPIRQVIQTTPTIEGAGVKLQRAFGFGKTRDFDPFLLLDDFRNDNPRDYLAGFPWHPHRGIETITYVLAGSVEHGDSLGNRGKMTAGDVQWMTAGSGILHQEMPKGDQQGRMHGFQLWANLPASLKMTDPRYQDIPSAAIPEVTDDDGTLVRVPVPALTEERRKEMVKHLNKALEEHRTAVRNIRRDGNDLIKKALKDKKITEDEERGALEQIQKLTDDEIKKMEELAKGKEKEVMSL